MADSLTGKIVAIKDNITTKCLPTTAASRALANYKSPFDATVVRLLREHGATISSKTNLDEFGMGSHSQNSASGPILSPYSRNGVALSPGGSSGGSAVEVATGKCWAALGTDTGGSVRLPAAYTGVVGFKPSYGLLSRWGVIQYANSLDTVGALARNVHDAATLFDKLNRHDPQDPTSLSPSLRKRIAVRTDSNRSSLLRIGIPTTYNIAELVPAVRKTYVTALRALQTLGHTLHSVDLPSTRAALPAYYVLAPAEASSNLAKYDGVRYGPRPATSTDVRNASDRAATENLPLYARTRGTNLGPEVRRRILLGAYTLSSKARDNYFVQAQRVRRLVQQDFDSVFASPNPLTDAQPQSEMTGSGDEKVDVLLTPTAPTLPPTVDEVAKQSSVEASLGDVFTVPASLAGLPAVSVPAKLDEETKAGLGEGDVDFMGLQVIGQFGDDEAVLSAAKIVEEISM